MTMSSRNTEETNVHLDSSSYWCSLKRLNAVVSRIRTCQSSDLLKDLEQLLQHHKPDLVSLLANEPRNAAHREAVQKACKDGITIVQNEQKTNQVIPEKVVNDGDVPGKEVNSDEQSYLDTIKFILTNGIKKEDRTGVGTISYFGTQNRYSLADGNLPLLTTKRVYWKGIVEELLWFIQGNTNSKELAQKGVHIWDANGSRTFLDSIGFTDRDEGDLGPVYGHQWRHWGADYVDTNTDYSGKGIDQLSQIIERIKTNPNDRRLIVCSWNVSDIPKMALPPCHCLFQFYVADGKLSCRLDQRSGDMGLGVPFNIASYALLTHMVAHITNLKPGEFIHQIGDAHIYLNHVDALEVQLTREPRPFPKLVIKRKVETIDDFKAEDFELINYKPYPKIEMPMAL